MKIQRSELLILPVVALLSGCSFVARDADGYREVTRAALSTKNPSVESCYDQLVAEDASHQGQVVVHFKVEKKTGKVVEPQVDSEATSASQPLQECVMASLNEVAIDEPDRRDGDATFTWTFRVNGDTAEVTQADESPAAQ